MRETGYESRRTEIVMRSLFLDYLATDEVREKHTCAQKMVRHSTIAQLINQGRFVTSR